MYWPALFTNPCSISHADLMVALPRDHWLLNHRGQEGGRREREAGLLIHKSFLVTFVSISVTKVVLMVIDSYSRHWKMGLTWKKPK